LYNETEGQAIHPTPVLGVVGLVKDVSRTCSRTFKRPGDKVVALGDNRGELGGSEYLARVHEVVAGSPPALDLVRERALQQLIVRLIAEGLVRSAHDCAEGGVAVTVAECTFDSGIGVEANLPLAGDAGPHQVAATLFGESASRIIVSVSPEHVDAVLEAARSIAVPAAVIGQTGGDRIRLTVAGAVAIDSPVIEAERAWQSAIERYMTQRAVARKQ
jgi:phosphoribosylformylglycinamidine synthase